MAFHETDPTTSPTQPEVQGHPRCEGDDVRVHRGDTLWSIAGDFLGTDDASRIAPFLPAVERANQDDVLDPDLIFPGQHIELPGECD